MRTKASIRLAVDALMTASLPALMAYNLVGETAHEVAGIIALALFAAHHAVNRSWYAASFGTRHEPPRALHAIVNLLLAAATAGLAASSVVVSRRAFRFLGVVAGPGARRAHVCFATWSFLLMSLHLGLHWSPAARLLELPPKPLGAGARKAALRCAAALICASGICASFARDMGAKLIAYYSFSFWDPDRSMWLSLADFASIMGMYACVAHYSLKWLRFKARKRASEGAKA